MASIPFVIEKYMSDVFHVHTDLMRTSGLEYTFYQCDISQPFQYLIMSNGMFSLSRVRHYCHLHAVPRIPADVSGDGTFVLFHDSPDKGIIFALGCFIVEL